LPEWADFEDSPLKKFADHYNQIKTKWEERDRMDLAELRRRFGSLDLGWQKFVSNKQACNNASYPLTIFQKLYTFKITCIGCRCNR
jgi:hypothetical protein